MKQFLCRIQALILLLVSVLALSSCAPSLLVPVQRPAEINLRGINKIAMGEIQGNGGQEIADLLTSKLFESGKFEVLERANLEKMMKEHQISLGGAIDEQTAAKIGKLVGAATLVFGNVSMYKYDLKTTYSDWKDRQGGFHRTYTKTGTAKVTATLKVVGLETGKILAVKTITKEAAGKTTANDGQPEDPDRDAAMDAARNAVVATFIKMIAPYSEYVTVTFAPTDKNLPELERGVNLAKAGRWSDAIEQFKAATQKNPTHAGAWWDLGLAYEYTYDFDKAEAAFNEAYKIKPDQTYLDEINNVKRLKAERKKLEEQGALESEGK